MRETELSALLRELRSRCPELPVLEQEPMAKHCSFRIGGPCDAMLLPGSLTELETVCRLLAEGGERPFLMGNGTNLLVTDGPFHHVVVRLGERFAAADSPGEGTLRAQAGITLAQLASEAVRRGLRGLEFAHGIPGTLGGAVSMNAGAYGGEMKDVTVRVKGIRPDGSPVDLTGEEMRFGYRRSAVTELGFVVTEVTLELQPGDPAAIRARMAELNAMRAEKQPLDVPSAGSTFKRPEGYFAAALIDQCGLKGYSVGGAQVSQKHAGFLINTGSSSGDYLELVRTVQRIVQERAGVLLEPEIKIIGEQGEA